jgi:hypothetical protein
MGGGRFAASGVGYGPWRSPSAQVTSRDLVGDGAEDLVIHGASMIQVVPILEDGTVFADRRLEVGANAGSPVVADLDGDGNLDVLAAHRDGQRLRAFLFDGDLGAPERTLNLETPLEPTDQGVMDVNLDGVADVLDLSRGEGSLGVRLGIDEDGVWSPGDRAAIAVGRSPVELLVTDIDGDDLPDVAVLLREDAAVAVLLHDGRSGFAEPVLYDVGGRPVSWAAGDLNRDGRVDLITVDSDDGRLSVLLGGADGVFEAARTINPDCAGPSGVAVGDVTGDEWPDLAIACTADGAVIVLPGIEEGGQLFGPAQFPYVATGGRPTIVRLSDVDKDGRLDMLVALDSNKVALLYGADPSECPDGGCVRFEDEVQVAYPYALTGLEVADLDGDGTDELITTLGSVVSVYRGQRIACPAVGEGEGEADP